MNKKYEFTGEIKTEFGVTLQRIRALLSFGAVTKGDIGGWISGEHNLSEDGNAWVYGEARVYGNARVSGEARVSGNARVYGNADFALVGPLGSRHAYLTVHADAKLSVRFTTGCFSDNQSNFESAIVDTHGDNKYARQYRAAIALALMIVKSK